MAREIDSHIVRTGADCSHNEGRAADEGAIDIDLRALGTRQDLHRPWCIGRGLNA